MVLIALVARCHSGSRDTVENLHWEKKHKNINNLRDKEKEVMEEVIMRWECDRWVDGQEEKCVRS